MSDDIERLQRAYDLALSNATCYSMRNRGWDSAEHERLGRVLREKHLELENARLRARVDELEAALRELTRQIVTPNEYVYLDAALAALEGK